MSRLIKTVAPILAALLLVSMFVATPALAQNSSVQLNNSFICGNALQGILANVMNIVVVLAALIGIGGGAAFTLASAAQPTEEEYQERRNKTILYGGGTLVVLYGANALIGQVADGLAFGCILPGV